MFVESFEECRYWVCIGTFVQSINDNHNVGVLFCRTKGFHYERSNLRSDICTAEILVSVEGFQYFGSERIVQLGELVRECRDDV